MAARERFLTSFGMTFGGLMCYFEKCNKPVILRNEVTKNLLRIVNSLKVTSLKNRKKYFINYLLLFLRLYVNF